MFGLANEPEVLQSRLQCEVRRLVPMIECVPMGSYFRLSQTMGGYSSGSENHCNHVECRPKKAYAKARGAWDHFYQGCGIFQDE